MSYLEFIRYTRSMETYNWTEIERKWQDSWQKSGIYKVEIDANKPKFFVLDMFPYPSGAGLHVGHPLGYIGSDIFSRYKRLRGFNVLHPMGYDTFGLPTEQYAIQTGQHPAAATEKNVARYREQLDKIGFSYDWSREVQTCDPAYYKWTQWVFIRLFHHWYDKAIGKARAIGELEAAFAEAGSAGARSAAGGASSGASSGAGSGAGSGDQVFNAEDWRAMSRKEQEKILLDYRLAYLANTTVNWCPDLGTVLANDEVKDGLSERGGHKVIQKEMMQWSLRISAYAQRLLDGLETLDWSDSLKDIQRNWIGRSEGAQLLFDVSGKSDKIEIFTTRLDTIYGATFMVIAPESDLVDALTSTAQRGAVDEYLEATKSRTERDRMANVKQVSGVFSGSYALNPITGREIPVWIADYVLAGYGTGAIMAVPAHDGRDWAFARKFGLPVIPVLEIPGADYGKASADEKEGVMINSGEYSGLDVAEATKRLFALIEKRGIGRKKINYRLRDAIFGRQRYWGEPFPIYYVDGMPRTLADSELPLKLPEVDAYLPTSTGEPPLGRAKNWKSKDGYPLELSTMPGFAGSCAYWLRYTDPQNADALVSRESNDYWKSVDLYVGGSEHATGHLIYSRFWTHFLFDLGIVCEKEPFKKLVNQGMIQGRSNFVYRKKDTNTFVSAGLVDGHDVTPIHVDVNIVRSDALDMAAFKASRPDYATADFILENGKYICGSVVEKMSKSKYNVVNPDDIITQYGADTLRLYEMFLGPIQVAKPWTTEGILGVNRFLEKVWKLMQKPDAGKGKAPAALQKILHKTIRKVSSDIEGLEFNTAISQMMICINELGRSELRYDDLMDPFVRILSPFAPHIAEELWRELGHKDSVITAAWPNFDPALCEDDTIAIMVQINNKNRSELQVAPGTPKETLEKLALADPKIIEILAGKTIVRTVAVPDRLVNIIIK